MKILFLHGTGSKPGDVKASYLIQHGHDVLDPALPDDDFDEAVRIAQAEYDQGQPDVVVGSSRGSAVAMNIDSGDTPLVLLCRAWKTWGTVTTVKPNTVVLHSGTDETVPFADSEELVGNSGLPSEALIEVGTEHRLADEESLAMMVGAVEWAATQCVTMNEVPPQTIKKIQNDCPGTADSERKWNPMPDAPKQIRVSDMSGVAVVCFNDLSRCAFSDEKAFQLSEELLAVADQKEWTSVILDFEGKEFVPAAIVEAPLVRLHKRLGSNLRMCNVPSMAMEQFQVNRLVPLFHIYQTREEALVTTSVPGD